MCRKMRLNRILNRAILPICVCIFFVISCVPEYENITTYEKTLASFFDKVRTHEQVYSFEAEAGFTHETARNTILNIPENAFSTQDGNIISGTVELTFIEVLDKSFIMLYDKPTITRDGDLLESAGVFYIDATQNGEELELNQNIEIQVVSDNTEDMRLFFWTPGIELGLNDGWRTLNGSSAEQSEWTTMGTMENVSGYTLKFDHLDWINCDRFQNLEDDQLTSFCLNLPDDYNNTNTISYVIYEDFNSIIRIPGNLNNNEFCYPENSAPIGYNVSIVVIRVQDDNQYELGIVENVAITANMNQDINMEALSLEQILDILAQF